MTLTHSWFTLLILKLRSNDGQDAGDSADVLKQGNADASNAERAFLRDLICEHSEAVQSELGVMALMSQYPRKF